MALNNFVPNVIIKQLFVIMIFIALLLSIICIVKILLFAIRYPFAQNTLQNFEPNESVCQIKDKQIKHETNANKNIAEVTNVKTAKSYKKSSKQNNNSQIDIPLNSSLDFFQKEAANNNKNQ